VQDWRKLNPGYWKRRSKECDALQDFLFLLQCLAPTGRSPNASERALQDILNAYGLLLLGLMTKLPKSNKKEIIDETFRHLILAGQKARKSLIAK